MRQVPTRQVHLDFHTSEFIPEVGKEFCGEEFAKMVKEAHVNSMTVFARCVHGHMYYPSKKFKERIHPTLVNQNLLLEQVRALHKEGMKAPVYIAVQWDRYTAERKPEWLIRKKDGAHEGTSFLEPGFEQSLCVNTEYFDFLAEHTMEVMDLLGDELDGLFFDIVATRPCYCSKCRQEMREKGIDLENDREVRAFAKDVIDRFKKRMSALVWEKKADCTCFYNAGHVGPCTWESNEAYSHYEVESLPSGQWGYLHFPITARYARTMGKDCVGMTGKFHTEWGDFHSLKNKAALEFECFRILSYGFGVSIGDQLEPNGRLNPNTYRLIGSVYEQIEQYEAYARPAVAVTEAALVTSENLLYELEIPESVMGAGQLLEEIGLQFDIISPFYDLEKYKLVILTDDFRADEAFQKKLDAYVRNGGKVLACGKGGLSENGVYPDCFCAKYQGEEIQYPTFLVPQGEMALRLEEGNEYVIYERGESIVPEREGKQILGKRESYFNREGNRFCSHLYTPSAKGALLPAAIRGENSILFSHPLFSQYRSSAPFWCKQLIQNAINQLLDERLVVHNGPSYLSVQILHQEQQRRFCVHILSYVPVRKSATIDIIEERTPVYDLELEFHLPETIREAVWVNGKENLPMSDGKVTVPKVDGYGILELRY